MDEREDSEAQNEIVKKKTKRCHEAEKKTEKRKRKNKTNRRVHNEKESS